MIIVGLSGGLGNQMFQYALGRHLAYINGTDLKFDISGFQRDKQRGYALEVFNISTVFASTDEVEELKAYNPDGFERLLNKMTRKKKTRSKINFVENKRTGFEPQILQAPEDAYFQGYWQSEKYFSAIEDIIREDFSFKPEMLGELNDIDVQMAETNSISVHIRRGDYVSDRKTRESHGVCSLNYYTSCVNEMARKVSSACFYIFSNDPQWVLDNLKFDFPKVVVSESGNLKDYEDMYLMSRCKHNIIANSSFSWWGAWLNSNKNKTVFAPDKWFLKKDWNYQDVVPPQWVKM